MSRRRLCLAILVAVLAATAVACTQQEPEFTAEDQVAAEDRPDEAAEDGAGDGAEEQPAGETVTFVAVDIDWADAPSEIPTGDVAFEMVNEGQILHNLVVEELGDELIAEAEGGETDTGTATLDAGEYTVYCDVPGHREAGMVTTVTAG